MQQPKQSDLIDRKEAETITGASRNTLRRLELSGRFPKSIQFRGRGKRFFVRSEVLAYMAALMAERAS